MSAKLKAAIGVLLILVGIATIGLGVFMLRGGEYEYGTVKIEGLADAGNSVVLEAVSFSVTAKQLTDAAQTEIWAGVSEEEAYAHAEKALIEKYAMYHKATANGIVPDEEAVRAEVELNRDVSKTASNYEDFQSFLDYIGMTHDEYWDSQYTNFLEYDVIEKFKQKLKSEFISNGKSAEDWESYYSALIAETVKKEKIKVVQRG